ncbi:hypothetical protein C7212DRAFT_364706 [Tuber magnatum]|uniref:Uncharacterized protein n=1 Tax=Tuber magnatum TaxID=42249 RepID=A0A317SME0_9PEZI|nr:hypothetical protein C7212DRAFT_364706 [Tuber magnatum]
MSVISAPIPSFEMEHVKADLERQGAFGAVVGGSERVRKHVEFAPYASKFEYPEPHYAPPNSICGIRRKIFWAIIAFVILLNVGTIAGLVVVVNKSKEGESSAGRKDDVDAMSTGDGGIEVDVSAFKGLPLLPGTSLAALNWGNDTRAYFQNGDGKVIQSYCGGESCTPARSPIIADARHFSPLENVGSVGPNSSIHIFYLSIDNTLREMILSNHSTRPTDGPLSAFNRQAHSGSDISATFSSGEIKPYYQDAASLRVQELLHTPTTGWANGSQLPPAAPGSRIATALWGDNLRVYFTNESSVLAEQRWAGSGGWFEGLELPEELAAKEPPYSTSSYNELFTFTEKDPIGEKGVVGNVRDMADGIAAVQTLDGVVSIWFVDRGGNLIRKTGDGEMDMRGGSVRVAPNDQDPEW